MLAASKLADHSACRACSVLGPSTSASGNVQTNGQGSLRMGDRGMYPHCCEKHAPVRWVASTGAGTVLINDQPAIAVTSTTTRITGRGAMVEGSANVFVGGVMISMEEMARADALAMIDKGLRSLERWNAEDKKHFKEWYGSDSESTREMIRARLLAMRRKLADANLVVGDHETYYAHVRVAGNTVNLDGSFWTAPRMGEDSRAGTLTHEVSHFWNSGGTHDYIYGRSGCRELARTNPRKAANNADSQEYWLETLP